MKSKLLLSLSLSSTCLGNPSLPEKPLMDFFDLATPVKPVISDGIWGGERAIPRDINNGLEDSELKNWCYWDGMIVKADDKYYMYASRWDQSHHHQKGWTKESKAIISVSENLLGPYRDLGEAWPSWTSKAGHRGAGHNVVGLRTKDGRYAMVTSEITDGNIFISDKPEGPFEHEGKIQIDYNGYGPGLMRYNFGLRNMANVMIFLRPDGRYMLMGRNCAVALSDELTGPYKVMNDTAWKDIPGVPQTKMEDPTIWFSDGLYHIVVNHYLDSDLTFHLTSLDGIHNWRNRGIAMSKEGDGIFRYTDGTINRWFTVQRPTVYLEDGVVKAFNFSVIDVHKGQDGSNDKHGSKIVVAPFDGQAFGKAMRELTKKEYDKTMSTPLPGNWKSVNIGSSQGEAGFETSLDTVWTKASGSLEKDELNYIHQKVEGDVMVSALIMSQDISPDMATGALMFRQSLKSGAKQVFTAISPTKGLSLSSREGTALDQVARRTYRAPYFVRMVKQGNSVTSYISQTNQYNWEKLGTTTIDFEGAYYAGVGTASENGKLSLARFKNLDVHPLKGRDSILWHDLDYSLSKSGKRTVSIAYETSQPRDITLGLQKTGDWTSFPEMRKTVNGYGVAVFEFDTGGLNPKAEKGYRWGLSLVPEKGNWKQSFAQTKKAVEALTE